MNEFKKMFNSNTLDSEQISLVLETLLGCTIVGKNAFISGNKGSGKTFTLNLIKLLSDIEHNYIIKLVHDKMKECSGGPDGGLNQKTNDSMDFLSEQFNSKKKEESKSPLGKEVNYNNIQDFVTPEDPEFLKKIYKVVCDKIINDGFNNDELEGINDEQIKQLYQFYRKNFPDTLFIKIDYQKINENSLKFSEIEEHITTILGNLSHKKKVVLLVDNVHEINSNEKVKEVFLSSKAFIDKGYYFILTGDDSFLKTSSEVFGDNIVIKKINLSNIEKQISEEILENNVFNKTDPGFKECILNNKTYILEKFNFDRGNKKQSEPSYTSNKLFMLFDDYQKKKILSISGKFKLGDNNLSEIKHEKIDFDIKGKIDEEIIQAKDFGKKESIEVKKLIKEKIIGQNESVDGIIDGILIGKMFNKSPKNISLFLGPTGVGKTETAKQVAKHVFGSEKKLILLQMNQYQEKHSTAKITGSNPGYVGFGETKTLRDQLIEIGEGVLVLDEIEKAHPDIFDFLLGAFSEGKISMGGGMGEENDADLSNFVIILTSNYITSVDNIKKKIINSSTKETGIGFNTSNEIKKDTRTIEDIKSDDNEVKEAIIEELKSDFKPEFLGRIDNFMVFNNLNDDVLFEIISKHIKVRTEELVNKKSFGIKESELRYGIGFDKDEIEAIVEMTKTTKLGARFAIKKTDEIIGKKIKTFIFGDDDGTSISDGISGIEVNGSSSTETEGTKRKNKQRRISK